jgi:hypothetical protein
MPGVISFDWIKDKTKRLIYVYSFLLTVCFLLMLFLRTFLLMEIFMILVSVEAFVNGIGLLRRARYYSLAGDSAHAEMLNTAAVFSIILAAVVMAISIYMMVTIPLKLY